MTHPCLCAHSGRTPSKEGIDQTLHPLLGGVGVGLYDLQISLGEWPTGYQPLLQGEFSKL
jgi:hypothetical protein